MKKNLLTLAVLLTVGFFTNDANAQSTTSKSADATATAKLIKPMSLTVVGDLNFGTINVGTGVAGTVELSTAGSNTYTGGVKAGPTAGALGTLVGNPTYTVGGTKNATYAVTLPADYTVTVEDTGSLETMTINTFTVLINSGTGLIGTLTPAGADAFKVGATLLVGTNQAIGNYSGSFNVSVDYN